MRCLVVQFYKKVCFFPHSSPVNAIKKFIVKRFLPAVKWVNCLMFRTVLWTRFHSNPCLSLYYLNQLFIFSCCIIWGLFLQLECTTTILYLSLYGPQKYPMAVVGTAGRGLIIYQLENQPQEFKRMESPLKYQVK